MGLKMVNHQQLQNSERVELSKKYATIDSKKPNEKYFEVKSNGIKVLFFESENENKNAYSRALIYAFDLSKKLNLRIRCDL